MHEDLRRQSEIKRGSDRALGFVFATFFLIVGCWPLINVRPPRIWAIALALAFLLIALWQPARLASLNRLWTAFGLLLHRLVSPLILGAMFFLVITPFAIIARILGKDSLRIRLDRASDSYWITREPPGPAPDSMRNQF